jgi:hypothetical protein
MEVKDIYEILQRAIDFNHLIIVVEEIKKINNCV